MHLEVYSRVWVHGLREGAIGLNDVAGSWHNEVRMVNRSWLIEFLLNQYIMYQV